MKLFKLVNVNLDLRREIRLDAFKDNECKYRRSSFTDLSDWKLSILIEFKWLILSGEEWRKTNTITYVHQERSNEKHSTVCGFTINVVRQFKTTLVDVKDAITYLDFTLLYFSILGILFLSMFVSVYHSIQFFVSRYSTRCTFVFM